MNEISASVVLYNTPEPQLRRLLDSIQKSTLPLTTYLVDNSPIASDLPCYQFPGITYIHTGTNKGYGAGHNVALRKILDSSTYHFVINPDIHFGPEEIEKMIAFMDADPAIGQLMPKVVSPEGDLQYLCKLLPTPADLLLRRFAFGSLRKIAQRHMERFELRHANYDKVMDVPYLSGCFMAFRTAALRRVGLFDERFFMYLEDIDITRRVHAEYRTAYYPQATVVHDHARESYKNRRALWTHIQNTFRYFNKWGWFRDAERAKFNRETLLKLQPASRSSIPSRLQ